MKKVFSALVNNAVHDLFTSFAGTLAGVPDIIHGVQSDSWVLILKGVGELLIGLSVNLRK